MTTCIIALLLNIFALVSHARAETIICHNFSGMRVDWFPSDQLLVKEGKRGKLEWNQDAISGMVATLAWTNASADMIFTTNANQNDSGAAASYIGTMVINQPTRKVFLVQQKQPAPDDAMILLTYYPRAKRIVWSGHATKFLVFEGGLHGKFMVGDCK
jgi:hypothetical protein